jgi:hypothetical protein
VSYFGNQIAASGESSGGAVVVDSAAVNSTRADQHGPFNLAGITDIYDYNRDRLVNATDVILARDNQTTPATALQLITVPAPTGSGPDVVVASADPAATEAPSPAQDGGSAVLVDVREEGGITDGTTALMAIIPPLARKTVYAGGDFSLPAVIFEPAASAGGRSSIGTLAIDDAAWHALAAGGTWSSGADIYAGLLPDMDGRLAIDLLAGSGLMEAI